MASTINNRALLQICKKEKQEKQVSHFHENKIKLDDYSFPRARESGAALVYPVDLHVSHQHK